MKGKMNAKMGNIIIDRDVLAKYARGCDSRMYWYRGHGGR